jgi:transaldolase / glucose-6-phosphate isomerase
VLQEQNVGVVEARENNMATHEVQSQRLAALQAQGQSVWYDNIRRGLINTGELQQLLDEGVVGITSNPTIFEKAIAGSSDYDDSLRELVDKNLDAREIFETLAIDDIGRAADVVRYIYGNSDALDGYVSIEVSPDLARDTEKTLEEARRLWATLDRPNIMIKVPATPEGIPAIRALISEGINVNVTMLFALENYRQVAGAYLSGLEDRLASGKPIDRIASVASIFVSRIDVMVDKWLEQRIEAADDEETRERLRGMLGKAAIANAKVSYALYQQIYGSERFAPLKAEGARPQRLLWASTGTKNPNYSDVMYVESLIGPETVNTMPPATLEAFLDHGEVHPSLVDDIDQANTLLEQLTAEGIDLDDVMQTLQDDGVAAFATSFKTLLGAVEEKLAAFRGR